MALRLTGSSAAPAGPPQPAALAAQAAALLDAGDVRGYHGLFALAAEHQGVHVRYQARKALLEQGLAACAHLPAHRTVQTLLFTARAAIELLEQEPREPVILNAAGVALYELWRLDAARALFEAARRLDPSLPHVARNLAELAARRRAGAGRRRAALDAAIPELAWRACRVADRARPATGLTLSLCMIVRDEEEMLPRCLAAATPAVDEVIVVDTGSRDRTVEIARSFGARVIEREWTGSFADARNVSFDAATGDWLMYLDADEVLIADDCARLRALTGRTWREAFYLVETNFTGDLSDGTAVTHNALRVFRNRPEYRFSGRLHEQIAQHLPAQLPERLEQTSVRLEHYGYLGAVRDAKEKSRRNIELLRAQQAESPATPFLHFNLGSEYAASGDAFAALAEFEQSWALIKAESADGSAYEFTPSLLSRLVKALRICGRPAEAIERANEGLALFPRFTDLIFEQATASVALNREADAISYYERCLELGDAPARYTATLGCGTFLPRIALAELKLHHGEAQAARELLEGCLEAHPGFFGSVLPYAAALLACGMEPEAVTVDVEQRVAEPTPTVRFMLGTALFEAGAGPEAEHQYRMVLDRQPHSAQARVALGEVLLYQRRYGEAAAEAAALEPSNSLAPIACRTELFGRLAGGDLAGASAALSRARTVGLPATDLAVFRGWAELAGGAADAPALELAAVPLLRTVLEALLRVHDFRTFELLVGLLAASELPERERVELLAAMYLRHGFLKSAAQEWMAVCRETPDLRALVGLAQVAHANGQGEQAADFARAALRLEPGNTLARAVIEQTARLAA